MVVHIPKLFKHLTLKIGNYNSMKSLKATPALLFTTCPALSTAFGPQKVLNKSLWNEWMSEWTNALLWFRLLWNGWVGSTQYKPVKNLTDSYRHNLIFYTKGIMGSQDRNSTGKTCLKCQSYSTGAGGLMMRRKRPGFLGPITLWISFLEILH